MSKDQRLITNWKKVIELARKELSFEVSLERVADNLFVGKDQAPSLAGRLQDTEFQVEVGENNTSVYVNNVLMATKEAIDAAQERLFLQYGYDDAFHIVGVGTESQFGKQTSLEAIVAPEVPQIVEPIEQSQFEPRVLEPLPKTLDKPHADLQPDLKYRTHNPKIYLAQCLEKDFLDKSIFSLEKKRVAVGRKIYDLRDAVTFSELKEAVDLPRKALWNFIDKHDLFDRGEYLSVRSALKATQYFIRTPGWIDYDTTIISRIFSTDEEIISYLQERGLLGKFEKYENPESALRGRVRDVFFDCIDITYNAWLRSDLILNKKVEMEHEAPIVKEENEREEKVIIEPSPPVPSTRENLYTPDVALKESSPFLYVAQHLENRLWREERLVGRTVNIRDNEFDLEDTVTLSRVADLYCVTLPTVRKYVGDVDEVTSTQLLKISLLSEMPKTNAWIDIQRLYGLPEEEYGLVGSFLKVGDDARQTHSKLLTNMLNVIIGAHEKGEVLGNYQEEVTEQVETPVEEDRSLDDKVSQPAEIEETTAISDPTRYLSKCLYERLLEEGYLDLENTKLILGEKRFAPDELIEYSEAAKYLGKNKAAVKSYAKNNGLVEKSSWRISTASTLLMKLWPTANASEWLSHEELADLYGADRESIERIPETGFFTPEESKYAVKKKSKQKQVFFDIFGNAIDLFTGGLETRVTEETSVSEPTSLETTSYPESINCLAESLGRRLREEGYFSPDKTIVINGVEYQPEDRISYAEATEGTERSISGFSQFVRNNDLRDSWGINSANALKARLWPTGLATKKLSPGEQADVYGTSIDEMVQLEEKGIFNPEIERQIYPAHYKAQQKKVFFKVFDKMMEEFTNDVSPLELSAEEVGSAQVVDEIPVKDEITTILASQTITEDDFLEACVERRMRTEGYYDPATNEIVFVDKELRYDINDRMSRSDIASVASKNKGDIENYVTQKLITRSKGRGYALEDVFFLRFMDISNKATYSTKEMMEFYGTNEESKIEKLVMSPIQELSSLRRPARVLREQYRDTVYKVMDALRAGETFFWEEVTTLQESSVALPEDLDKEIELPRLVEVINYNIVHIGDSPVNTVKTVINAYQDEHDKRRFAHFVSLGMIKGAEVTIKNGINSRVFPAREMIPVSKAAFLFGKSEKGMQRRIRKLPSELYEGKGSEMGVSPFAALVLYHGLTSAMGVRETYGLDAVADEILFDPSGRDAKILEYLKTNDLVITRNGNPLMAGLTFSSLYTGLTERWAVRMTDDQQRSEFMHGLGYLDTNRIITTLTTEHEMELSTAHRAIERLRPKAVLGMVHGDYVTKLAEAK